MVGPLKVFVKTVYYDSEEDDDVLSLASDSFISSTCFKFIFWFPIFFDSSLIAEILSCEKISVDELRP